MSQWLELPDSVYEALKASAEASGTTPAHWLAAHLPQPKAHTPNGDPRTLAELFGDRIGRIRSGGRETLSENCGEKFAAYLEQKKAEGHL
jgi:hypothetical protein